MAGVGRRFLLAAFAVVLAACGGAAEGCDGDELRVLLARAVPGEEVRIGACRVEGPFVVPAGVMLSGVPDLTQIEAPADGVGVELAGDGAALLDVIVLAGGRVGILARAEATVVGVQVLATRGIAVAVSETGALSLGHVVLAGGVSTADLDSPRFTRVLPAPVAAAACPSGAVCECTPGDVDGERACDSEGRWATLAATHGLVVRGGRAGGIGVRISGFAEVAALVVDGGRAAFSGLWIADTLGVGVLARDSTVELFDSGIERTREGLRGRPSYAVLSGDSSITSRRLMVEDNDRFGLVAVGGAISHRALSVVDSGDVSVWAAGVSGMTLRADLAGQGSTVTDGAFAGVVITDSSHVSISDLRVDGVRSSRRPVGLIGAVEIGDGLHLIRTHEDVSLSRVDVRGAARAGLTLELSAGAAAPLFTEVTIDATGSALGAVAGAPEAGTDTLRVGAVPAGWDSGITRSGAALANDAAFTGTLDAVLSAMPPRADEVLGVVAPMY